MFAAARYQPKIVAAMQRPLLEPPKWYAYAPQFLSPARIEGGVAWWNSHAAVLARAEETYGVPAEVITAIVGVETFYGRNTGSHRAIDALSTLAFDYPRRAAFFRGELKHFLLLARDLGVSPLAPKGSFAGALGVPQFMPGSYRNFAVDFGGDGRVDLWTDPRRHRRQRRQLPRPARLASRAARAAAGERSRPTTSASCCVGSTAA